MKTQLLCTFTRQSSLDDVINIIIECNDILYDKIYVFSNVNDSSQLMCTYNVEFDDGFQDGIMDTISLHRKKQTNTLYTINALNEVIRSKNNGVLDKKEFRKGLDSMGLNLSSTENNDLMEYLGHETRSGKMVINYMDFNDFINSDDGKVHGIRPRWGKVFSKGPRNKDDYNEGDWILIEHGRWTRGMQVEFDDQKVQKNLFNI